MLIEGQDFIDEQDELSVLDFMRKYGMPDRINEEVFISMAKALDFIDPDKLSMTVVLTAMNRFLNETDGLQMAFLDGNQPDRLCAPMVDHIKAGGGDVKLKQRVKEFVLNDDGSVKCLKMVSGEEIVADEYVSAVPVDIMKRMMPKQWAPCPSSTRSRSSRASPSSTSTSGSTVSSRTWTTSASPGPRSSPSRRHVHHLQGVLRRGEVHARAVFAPCSPIAGSGTNWIAKSNEEIVAATMKELERLFRSRSDPSPPTASAPSSSSTRWSSAQVVYAAIPGGTYRPSQATPISFTLAGDWTSQVPRLDGGRRARG